MRKIRSLPWLSALAIFSLVSQDAEALNKRASVTQQGDFVLIGNTLAQDCSAAILAPAVGTLDCTNAGNTADLTPDVFWRAESGMASANSSILADQAQSASVLTLPPGATVTHAFLYWAGLKPNMPDDKVNLLCVDQGGAVENVQAQSSFTTFTGTYSAVADVTQYVKMYGACTYMVGGVDSIPLNLAQAQPFGYTGWWMAVFYQEPKAPHRYLALYDGLDPVGNGGDSIVSISEFWVPKNFASLSQAKLGVMAFDGDAGLTGDKLLLADTPLEDMTGNANNFFNGSRTWLGAPVSNAGDLPQLTGQMGSVTRMDLDVLDITAMLAEGQAQLDIKAVSDGELFDFTGLLVSIPTFTDTDADGLSDDEELALGTNPMDRDSDDDGVDDNQEGCSDPSACAAPDPGGDADGDGIINAMDPDSDGDGLFDGTEAGRDCSGTDTKVAAGFCVPDADMGATKTDPLIADTDGGGIKDGSEDINLNGAMDAGETDPTVGHGADDSQIADTDKDGLSDGLEIALGSDPNDMDSDDDGLVDGLEIDPAVDSDGDGLINLIDPDSDNDALYDGTEAGKSCDGPGTDKAAGHCIADADMGATKTSPIIADTDGGGVRDGSEDANRDGAVGAGETDPQKADDDAQVADTDSDGLSDELEISLGTKTNDADSDDDGLMDGNEANPADDTDGDGTINLLDDDSDNDLLKDGTERGMNCNDPATDKAQGHCVPDGDKGKSKTSMLLADTDGGGVSDGKEDTDKDGVYDASMGEGDPLDPTDDSTLCLCSGDAECGPADSGKICEACACQDGCRGAMGNGCPDGLTCSSIDDSAGVCSEGTGAGGAGSSSSSGGGGSGDDDGCSCTVPGRAGSLADDSAWALLALGAALYARRRNAKK